MKFTEAQLEQAFISLLQEEEMTYLVGSEVRKIEFKGMAEPPSTYGHIVSEKVLLTDDLKNYLRSNYASVNISESEIESIVRDLERLPSSDLYESNKAIMKMVSDGFLIKREDRKQKDFYVQLIDYSEEDNNTYKIVNQLAIKGYEMRIPDLILYINGLPLVVFEFKTAIQENTTIHDAYVQLTTRYKRDIPDLFKYNAFCVISDGVNTKAGSFFGPYEFFYAWRKIEGMIKEVDGIDAMFTLIKGMFNKNRLRDIIQNFIYLPDSTKKNEKIVCRYPQYYAATKLFENIKIHQRPEGDGKGGTYFGTTGCGKSYTMLFLSRLLMKSTHFGSPTIILITDRTDLDDQLSGQFTNAKGFVGDDTIVSVESRSNLRELVQGRNSGGVFLTTIHKFTEDTKLLTTRNNVICISDEAHRSQTNLDQKVKVTEKGVVKTFGFAKYLHDSLPNATYVGFTGTPIDATIDVFGDIVDAYTMKESVIDEITVRIVYEGRAAKVLLNNSKLHEIENYYNLCAEEGSNEHQIEESKKAMAQMNAIIGDPKRLKDLAQDFVTHYENRITEGATVKGKAMFVCSSRPIAYEFYKNVLELRPEWGEIKVCDDGVFLTDKEKKEIKPMERMKMVMTRGKDDPEDMYYLLGTKDDRKEMDRQFKNEKSNFKIAIVVDMWLTGFDVPFLDTMYIDKPIQRHNLIQTISRVNRKFEGKNKGLIVDYIGIKKQMNLALAHYNKKDSDIFEDIEQSILVVKDQLDLLHKLFHKFDNSKYFNGTPLEQLNTLNKGAEFAQITQDIEKRFMYIVKRLKAAYDICSGSDAFTNHVRDEIHFFLAVRSIVFKLTKGVAPDTAQMNNKVRNMIQEAIESEGIEEIFKLGETGEKEVDIFSEDYLAKLDKIKLPNTKIKLLQKLLAKAIEDVQKINKIMGIDFSKRLQFIVDKYNERKESDVLNSIVLEDFTDEIIDLYFALKKEKDSFKDLGIDIEEKAFYDILKALAIKYDFDYPEDKLIILAQKVKEVVDDKAKYTDWSKREDIKAELKVGLIILLADNGYPPVDRDEVYKEIFEQAENFKKYRA
ncbi:type I restriction endonuclease subunit R [Flavobacterium sp. ZE23DGlu08]|uniref:type I restriction endonuclease subunit R n=1 Tax=Flavobacterium sp. ZE23DGlu08 TaxID=3059026 RepID=UPI00265E3FE9|nr:type I restriction endonuclease subunit R [Flavobacterium sp. ZE23DGlu08]WKL44170.1 type I restriction endonuclease subunit R [Flavobacterium sp. ZE23DGlu08]